MSFGCIRMTSGKQTISPIILPNFDVDRLIAVFVILHYDMGNRIRPQLRRLIRHMRLISVGVGPRYPLDIYCVSA